MCSIIAPIIDTHARPTYQLINMLNIKLNMTVGDPNENKYDATICLDQSMTVSGGITPILYESTAVVAKRSAMVLISGLIFGCRMPNVT